MGDGIPCREIANELIRLIRSRGVITQCHLGRYEKGILDFEKALALADQVQDKHVEFMLRQRHRSVAPEKRPRQSRLTAVP